MISRQLVPHGGWKFREERTNTTLVALDFNSLVKMVTDHRKSNGFNEGDVEFDIEDQLEKAQPNLIINGPR